MKATLEPKYQHIKNGMLFIFYRDVNAAFDEIILGRKEKKSSGENERERVHAYV